MKYPYRYNKKRDKNGLLLQDGEVLRLLLKAKSRPAISAELNMPMGTVNTCCSRIFEHTGCHSLAELLLTQNKKD